MPGEESFYLLVFYREDAHIAQDIGTGLIQFVSFIDRLLLLLDFLLLLLDLSLEALIDAAEGEEHHAQNQT